MPATAPASPGSAAGGDSVTGTPRASRSPTRTCSPASAPWHDLHGADLNEALCRLAGTEITAKDFRTWHATVPAAVGLAVTAQEARATPTARRRQMARTVREVSHYLGSTPAVCRASYIDPRVFELFEEGETIAPALTRLGEHGDFGRPATQGAVEAAVLDLLGG